MNPISIPEIKRILSRVQARELKRIVARLGGLSSKSEIRKYLVEALLRRFPSLFLKKRGRRLIL